jgi:serine/threonine-protein kinase HipA
MGRFDIDQKAFDNIFERFKKTIPKWHGFVEKSFFPDEMKEAYQVMIDKKAKQIEL